jgi:membrane protein implicated in regulation of membrane protease activity
MSAAVIWLIVALGLAGVEALTGDMFLLMLGGGALAAAGSSWLLDLPIWTDGAVFLVVSVLLLVLVRPTLRRRLTPAESLSTGIKALEGKSALVLDRVARRTRDRHANRWGHCGGLDPIILWSNRRIP